MFCDVAICVTVYILIHFSSMLNYYDDGISINDDYDVAYEVREEIARGTGEVAGSGKCMVDDPINLKVYSPNIVNLTLVDLPGMTKVPFQDQPEDIEDRIRELCEKYSKDPSFIIVAVSAANNDLANSEALKLAMRLDHEAARTLCTMTKLDLMDDGTDAKDILMSNANIRNFKPGVISVVNRSQADINTQKPIEDALANEALSFKKNHASLAHQNYTGYREKRLNELCMRHIKSCLPNLKTEINIKIKHCTLELQEYGVEIRDKRELMMGMITNFNSAYVNTIVVDDHKSCAHFQIEAILHQKWLYVRSPFLGYDDVHTSPNV